MPKAQDDHFLISLLHILWGDINDPAHDLGHVKRVVNHARAIAAQEGGDLDVIIPAAWLHDCVNLPKDHPKRAHASVMAAEAACEILAREGVGKLDKIYHAIAAHSFSAKIEPETLEAKILQDADRLDALGAIGMARMFSVGGALGRAMFDANDVLAQGRTPDDGVYTLDHIWVKLMPVAKGLQTQTGRDMAQARVEFMLNFARQVAVENA